MELDPNNNQIGVIYHEIPLSAFVVMQDSLGTTNFNHLVFGSDQSDFFGKTEATAYSRLFFNEQVAKPTPTAILDSVKFNMSFRFVLSDELTTPKTIRVHRLNEQIRDILYYSNSSLDYDPTPIFTQQIDFSAKQDTVVTFDVNNEFTQQLFADLASGNVNTDIFTFREYLPGLVFTGAADEEVSFTIRPSVNTGFMFFYHIDGDTVSRNYPIATGLQSNLARHFNQIERDATGTPTEQVTEPWTAYDLGGKVGSKGNTGLLVKLDTRPLQDFLDTLTNVTFNQVTLEVGMLKDFQESNSPFPVQIIYQTNETNRILQRSDGRLIAVQPDRTAQVDPETGEPAVSSPPTPALLRLDSEQMIYRQSLTETLTAHVNAVYRGTIPRRDFLLYPGQVGNDDFKFSLREYVIDTDKIKIKIFYSKTRAF